MPDDDVVRGRRLYLDGGNRSIRDPRRGMGRPVLAHAENVERHVGGRPQRRVLYVTTRLHGGRLHLLPKRTTRPGPARTMERHAMGDPGQPLGGEYGPWRGFLLRALTVT
jgi:hypothetical protein